MKTFMLLVSAPLLGAALVVFLPVIGFALVGYALALKAAEGMVALDKATQKA